MQREQYTEILKCLRQNMTVTSSREYLSELTKQFDGVSIETVGSIYSQDVQRRMKKQHYKHNNRGPMLYRNYQAMVTKGKKHVLLRMAEQIDLSPALLGRIILEQHVTNGLDDEDEMPTKSALSEMMKDPATVDDPVLANELQECMVADENYGPLVDTIKHSVGHEYEFKLVKQVEDAGLSYLGEDQMRLKGYDKTPDIKLEIPIAIDGHVVNWIESKASFGDDESHKNYLKDQFWSYWNRFGPGLVIYWFGFIDDLNCNQEKGIILRDNFPQHFVRMEP